MLCLGYRNGKRTPNLYCGTGVRVLTPGGLQASGKGQTCSWKGNGTCQGKDMGDSQPVQEAAYAFAKAYKVPWAYRAEA